jgi:DHA1 family inner membrane transport protein
MTASALGLAIGGPVLTALTIRIDRRSVLIGALAAFVVFTALPVVVTDYHLFLVARVASGALQGLLIAAAFFIGPAVVAPERAGRAMSIVLSGFAVSTAAGVPVGTLIGHEFGWRGAFVAVLVLASVVLAASLLVIPSAPSGGGGAAGQARSAFAPRVLALLGLFFLVFAANGSALTYLVPFLQHVTGVTGAPLSVFLLAYGAATLAGSVGGGRLADATASRTLIAGTAALCAALLTLFLVGSSAWLVVPVLVVWGLAAFGMTPSIQLRVVTLAGRGGGLASSLPASAANAGIAVGSVAGGVTVDVVGVRAVTLTGLAIAVAAVLVAVLTRSLQPPATDDAQTQPDRELVAP